MPQQRQISALHLLEVPLAAMDATLAEELFRSLHTPSASHPAAWAGAILAMAVCFVANASLTALVIALVGGKPFLRVLLPPLGANLLHDGSMLAGTGFGTTPRARSHISR